MKLTRPFPLKALCVMATLAVIPLPYAGAAVYSNLYSFGDSLSDTGNTSMATGGQLPGAGYYNGRYSNGPVWVERLAEGLGLPAPAPSLQGGKDYAWAGAYVISGGLVPTVTTQVATFTAGGGTFLPTDLVTLWGGANDLVLGSQPDPLVPAAGIVSLISTLAGAGAKTILLPNLPDLGDTPEFLSTNNPAAIMGASVWSQTFNAYLDAQVPLLEAAHGIRIQQLDVYGIGKELKENPGLYGFSNTTTSALLSGNAANADQYLYWDTVHPTSRVHEIFAMNAIPEPGVTLLLGLVGAGWAAARSRRAA